jgi:3-oxoacyl-[acyl-carrier-protein] synthase III
MSVMSKELVWRVSSWTNGANCVEVADAKTAVLVRDTKSRSQGILSFPPTAWEDFIRTVQTDNITFK